MFLGTFFSNISLVYVVMTGLKYELVSGFRRNSQLIWIPEDKHLYVKKKVQKKSRKAFYVCYNSIMFKNKICKTEYIKCLAGIAIDCDSVCARNSVKHTNHINHELLYKDFISRKNIINACITPSTLNNGIEISARAVFTKEISK